MSVTAIVGGQWGDEGKGKIIDLLAERVKMVIRFSGGDNAGHTVINPYGRFQLHLVPSGIFCRHVTCIIGNGVAVNPAVLFKEIDGVRTKGVDTSRLFVSERAHLIMPYHTLLDRLEEERLKNGALGTTRRGIGPAFADKVSRVGIRVGDLLNKDLFHSRLESALQLKNAILTKVYGASPLSLEEIHSQYSEYAERLGPFIRETNSLVHEALAREDPILLEGAQGALLDPDFGTYPYVTSSSPLAGAATTGIGIGPTRIDRAAGVFKAYITRVGSGPMPTEMKDEIGDHVRDKAHEYGATTGRPRRCGWFDAVLGGFSVRINGLSDIALTHLDIYDGFPSIKICTAYRCGDKLLTTFPSDLSILGNCEPVYEEIPAWQESTSEIRSFDDLPHAARNYIARLETHLSCPVNLVSVGPERGQILEQKPLLP